MPTPRSPNVDKRSDERKQAEKIYLESKGSLKLVEIAEKLKVPPTRYGSGSPWTDGRQSLAQPKLIMAKKTSGAFHFG